MDLVSFVMQTESEVLRFFEKGIVDKNNKGERQRGRNRERRRTMGLLML